MTIEMTYFRNMAGCMRTDRKLNNEIREELKISEPNIKVTDDRN